MGLFDRLMGQQEVELSAQGAILLAAISMVSIDGDVDDDEVAIIRRIDGSRVTDAWENALKVWKMNSIEDCVAIAAGALNDEQRMITIANLVDIAMADGILAGAEKQLLEHYVTVFELTDEPVQRIVEVIALKNNKSAF